MNGRVVKSSVTNTRKNNNQQQSDFRVQMKNKNNMDMQMLQQALNMNKRINSQVGNRQNPRASRMNPYTKSILLPFTTFPIKPYYDYPINTSIFETTYEFPCSATYGTSGVIPTGTSGLALQILPHAYNLPFNLNQAGSSTTNIQNCGVITQYTAGLGTTADVVKFERGLLNGLQGASNSSSAYYSSARTVRCGIRLIPLNPSLTKSGLVQIIQIPGKDASLSVTGYSSSNTIPFPSTTQIKQFASSYECSNAGSNGIHQYAWIPTDPMDSVFMQDNMTNSESSGTITSIRGDINEMTNHFRNPIFILVTDTAVGEKFRLEVKITYEYIPTTAFRPWITTSGPRATATDVAVLKDTILENPASQALQNEEIDLIGSLSKGVDKIGSLALENEFVKSIAHSGLGYVARKLPSLASTAFSMI